MRLNQALKLRKKLVGEITKLKQQIKEKNSYLVGSLNAEKFKVNNLYDDLISKTNELVGLKFAINEANREIQSKIYVLSEYKSLLTFWNEVSVVEGLHEGSGYMRSEPKEYRVQFDEEQRDEIVGNLQMKIDAIQEEIDLYNFNIEIPDKELNENFIN
jgi:hypothetical protein